MNYIPSIDDNDVERVIHLKSDNIKIMINDEAVEVIKKLFDWLKDRYQRSLQLMRGSEFTLYYVQLLYYECHKIDFNHTGSYIYSPVWIKQTKKQQ